jgi:hypothetical protein
LTSFSEENPLEEHDTSEVSCSNCDGLIGENDWYCPHCGAIFKDGVACLRHPGVGAHAVCVVCGNPCCEDCGGEAGAVFLCTVHIQLEIAEGMARIYGTTDNLQAQYIARCLGQAGLHPFSYSRRYNPGADVSAFIAYRQFGGYILEEIKILVPFDEVEIGRASGRERVYVPV